VSKIRKAFTETPVEGSVSEDYFHRMFSPQALKHSAPYHREESKILKKTLVGIPYAREMNFIAVGKLVCRTQV
jgi:hypothetical protein